MIGLAKVNHLDREIFHEQNIFRLEVQMNDFVDVQEPEDLRNLAHNVNYLLE